MTYQTYPFDGDNTIDVIWNARPAARARHEVRHVDRHGTTAWYPYDDQAMTEIFGLTVPDRYR